MFLLFILQKSSNPVFMRTIVFGSGMSDKTDIKMEAYDMRERYTSTKTLLGKILYLFQYKMKLEFLYYDLEKNLSNKYFFISKML